MIPFEKISISQKDWVNAYLLRMTKQCCEYSFVNLYLWGRKRVAELDGFLLLQAQYDRKSVYLYPVGEGDLKKVLDAIIHDAGVRGIPCCLIALTEADCRQVEEMYPGKFQIYCDRDSYDYLYAIEDLAELRGRKFQNKRNHLNRFEQEHPQAQIVPLDGQLLEAAQVLAHQWYEERMAADPERDYHLEQIALQRAFAHYWELDMEGVALMEEGKLLAFAMGSRLDQNTFDIHFEKALGGSDANYAAINRGFARYLREKYPELQWLNREDDMGIEGLRRAKLSYNPDHMVEKCWARLWEEEDER